MLHEIELLEFDMLTHRLNWLAETIPDPPDRESYQRNSKNEEQACLDTLQWPEPVSSLVGNVVEPAVIVETPSVILTSGASIVDQDCRYHMHLMVHDAMIRHVCSAVTTCWHLREAIPCDDCWRKDKVAQIHDS